MRACCRGRHELDETCEQCPFDAAGWGTGQGVEFWRLVVFCSYLRKADPKAGEPQKHELIESKVTLGLSLYNRDEKFGTDAEVVEMLGRSVALLDGQRDPIFEEEDEADGVVRVEGAGDTQWA